MISGDRLGGCLFCVGVGGGGGRPGAGTEAMTSSVRVVHTGKCEYSVYVRRALCKDWM
jgi:hypothetical protein